MRKAGSVGHSVAETSWLTVHSVSGFPGSPWTATIEVNPNRPPKQGIGRNLAAYCGPVIPWRETTIDAPRADSFIT